VTLQEWIYHWEEGTGAKLLKVAAAILAFVALAALFDALAYESFSSEEAMETAQLARNLARGNGYTTQSIRPLSIYLLRQQAPPGQAAGVPLQPMPDLSTPPAYPVLLAGLMAVLPFNFAASQFWYFAPERWIAVFNQVLFFVAVLLLFCIARRLFDLRVAWLSAVLFTVSNLFWKFTVSGLSTLWLMVVFLAAVLCLVRLQEREQARRAGFGSAALAALAGVGVGVGALSRYAFIWMISPVLLFIGWVAPRGRARLCAVAGAAFLLLLGPWIARNLVLSGTCFGTASYAILGEAHPFEEDTLERSFDPQSGLRRMGPLDVVDKFVSNAREMWLNELPRLGGNWVSAFFLAGLLMPFRNPALGRMRIFLLCSMALLFVVQAAGQTHLSSDSPEINSENLLVLLAPLVFVYGVAFFYTLLDQLQLGTAEARGAVVALFVLVASAPLVMSLLVGHPPAPHTPYSPLGIQRVAQFMRPQEFMVSDIPAAVAWYGDRQCGWLPLDDEREFYQFNSLKPIKAVYLTQRTTNSRFLSQMMLNPKSWGHFVVECEGHGEVPTGFPLTNAPLFLLPDQMLLSDQARWRMPPPNP
jgi:4-amino-4-deoxy-L-arabinose transferase-like glycosyltransferase